MPRQKKWYIWIRRPVTHDDLLDNIHALLNAIWDNKARLNTKKPGRKGYLASVMAIVETNGTIDEDDVLRMAFNHCLLNIQVLRRARGLPYEPRQNQRYIEEIGPFHAINWDYYA